MRKLRPGMYQVRGVAFQRQQCLQPVGRRDGDDHHGNIGEPEIRQVFRRPVARLFSQLVDNARTCNTQRYGHANQDHLVINRNSIGRKATIMASARHRGTAAQEAQAK